MLCRDDMAFLFCEGSAGGKDSNLNGRLGLMRIENEKHISLTKLGRITCLVRFFVGHSQLGRLSIISIYTVPTIKTRTQSPSNPSRNLPVQKETIV